MQTNCVLIFRHQTAGQNHIRTTDRGRIRWKLNCYFWRG